jgi:hypothetical protein
MPAEDYRKAYALSLIDKFPALPKGRPFPRIQLDDVVLGLRERVKDPRKQNQGAASLCGPAAFFYCILNYKPELYVQYVIDLFTTGKARIGSLKVEPSLPCRVYAPPQNKIAAVDWIALASLRDSENAIMDYSSADDTAAGITRPGTLASWFRHIGYESIRDNTNYYFCKGAKEIQDFDRDMRVYRDVCLLVNDNILYPLKNKSNSTFCNHWIVLDDVPQLNGSQINISVYSWGASYKIPNTGSLPVQDFSRNFYGYVSGKPKYS